LLKHSEDGISLFPAQPFLYLMNGRALNSLRKNSEALSVMEEGLDYIIEDDQLKSAFYEEMSLSYKASGNNKMATEYYNRAMELKDE
jgi:tetratricopeptide (TPR) repeat protein